MSFTVQDCYAGITQLLMNRTVAQAVMQQQVKRACLEFTEDYKHPLLEETGPTVSLVPYQNVYDPNFFLKPTDANLDVSKVNSFFLLNSPFVTPTSSNNASNTGYDLKFMAIKDIEVLLNVPTAPMYWSRNNNKIYITMPNQSYDVYMRYQKQHPFSNPVVGTDVIFMADTWQEILEYAAAMRIAPTINLANKKQELHTALYGDTKFQTSSGIEGAPGLIFQRTSQRNRDQTTTTRRLRLRMGSV